ncbi:MAG: NifU family protein [Acidimicrobiales bacterium]
MTLAGEKESTFEQRAARIDAARRDGAYDELVAAIEEHHAAVLHSLVARFRADERGRELLYEAVDDPEVCVALVKAGIVPPTLAMRAVQVLDGMWPFLTSHGGHVDLVKIDQGVAYVRLLGACQSCGSASDTLRNSVAEALLGHLPEITEVQEVPPDTAPATTFIPLSSVSFGRSGGR